MQLYGASASALVKEVVIAWRQLLQKLARERELEHGLERHRLLLEQLHGQFET